ncbi:MAG: putative metalloprotease YpwA [candidate division WS6 bacterium OLB20]|uniref:Putative metalloprotease YpwA n=1 Tax=candidate division WS6 bacterium OLB20 TaxID=1617426 RepID=A0A136LXT0_9BACT|nr:MAG: putative metalloprotease YpwA [candidate division WS6 bacterium OLB20]
MTDPEFFPTKRIKELIADYEPVWALGYLAGLAEWDLNTYMPEDGAQLRGSALGHISVLQKKLLADPAFRKKLSRAESEAATVSEHALIRVLNHDLLILDRLPESYLHEFQQVTNEAHIAWKKARERSDFSIYRPLLEKIVELTRRKADLIGFDDHPYDALLDTFEEGLTTAEVDTYFSQLKPGLLKLLPRHPSEQEHELAAIHYQQEDLAAVSNRLLEQLYENNRRLRLDVSRIRLPRALQILMSESPQGIILTTSHVRS